MIWAEEAQELTKHSIMQSKLESEQNQYIIDYLKEVEQLIRQKAGEGTTICYIERPMFADEAKIEQRLKQSHFVVQILPASIRITW